MLERIPLYIINKVHQFFYKDFLKNINLFPPRPTHSIPPAVNRMYHSSVF